MHPAADGQNVVDMIITDLAVFQRSDHTSPFRLIELAPEVTAQEVAARTTRIISPDVATGTMRPSVGNEPHEPSGGLSLTASRCARVGLYL